MVIPAEVVANSRAIRVRAERIMYKPIMTQIKGKPITEDLVVHAIC